VRYGRTETPFLHTRKSKVLPFSGVVKDNSALFSLSIVNVLLCTRGGNVPTKREVKPAMPEKPAARHKVSGTVKPALNQKPYTKIEQKKRTIKRALAK
jgi:hypothetical protein